MGRPSQRSGLTKHETRTSLATFNWSLGFRSVFITICAGTAFPFVAFALLLGIEWEWMGFVGSVVSFACVIQMLGMIVSTRVKHRKSFILSVGVCEPFLMMVAVLLVPFLPAGTRMYALAAAAFVAAAAMHLTSPLASDWVASTIPAAVRGRYLGRRFQIMNAAIIVTMLAAGVAMDAIGKTNVRGLACLLTAGGLFGVAAVLALRRATMSAVSLTSQVSLADVPRTLRHRPFRRYVWAMVLYNVPFLLACPYYQVLNIDVLGMKARHIAYMFAGYYVVKILVSPLIGRYVDRKGARWTLLAFGPVYVLFFVGLTVGAGGSVWLVAAAWALVGIADAGYMVAMMSALYGSIPEKGARPAYFAVYSLFSLMSFGIGGMVAVPVLKSLKGVTLSIGSLTLDQFQIFFAICTVMMIASIFGALLLVDPRRDREPA